MIFKRKTQLRLEPPPWVGDPDPSAWVSLATAARFFDRSRQRIHQWCHDGTFEEAKIPTHFDGVVWRIRLPGASACNNVKTVNTG